MSPFPFPFYILNLLLCLGFVTDVSSVFWNLCLCVGVSHTVQTFWTNSSLFWPQFSYLLYLVFSLCLPWRLICISYNCCLLSPLCRCPFSESLVLVFHFVVVLTWDLYIVWSTWELTEIPIENIFLIPMH